MPNNERKECPTCGQPIHGHPAISRADNRTEICSDCGTTEAIEAFVRMIPKREHEAIQNEIRRSSD